MTPTPTVIRLRPRSLGRFLVGLLSICLVALVSITVLGREASSAPTAYSIWPASAKPTGREDPDTTAVTLGVRFTTSEAGVVTDLRFYKTAGNTGRHVGKLWNTNGKLLAQAVFVNETATGWQSVKLATPVALRTGVSYVAAYTTSAHYADDISSLSDRKVVSRWALRASAGVYTYGHGVPSSTWRDSNYFVDVMFQPGGGGSDPTPSGTTTSTPTSTGTTTSSPTTTRTTGPTQPPTTTRPTTPPPTTTTTRTPTTPPTTTTSTTPTPPPTTTRPPTGCGAFPDSSCTGWAHTGVQLRTVSSGQSGSGWRVENNTFYVTSPGAVIDGLDIPFCAKIMADDVTIQRSRISCASYYTVNVSDPPRTYQRLKMTDVEIDGRGRTAMDIPGIAIMAAPGATLTRLDIHGFGSSGPRLASNSVLQDSYIHDFVCSSGWHSAGTTANDGGSNISILRNNIDINTAAAGCASTSIGIDEDFGSYDGVTVRGNLVNGGAYCMYAAQAVPGSRFAPSRNIHIENNTFGRKYTAQCGIYGPVAQLSPGHNGNTVSGNVWGDGAAATSAHRTGDPVP